jgi:membrane protease YdiL (CAAX protease family)
VEPDATAPAPPPAPAGRKSAAAFFGLLLVLFLPGLLAQTIHVVVGLLWTELFVFLLPPFVLAAGSNLEPRAYLALDRVRSSVVALGALVGVAGTLLAMAIMALSQRLLPPVWVRTFDVARLFEAPLAERIAIAAIATLVAPVCEEIAFRGYLQSTLLSRRRPALAVAAAAVLFAIIHLDPVRFPALVVLGAVFGWLRQRAGSVWPAVAAHAANNGLVSIVALSARPDPTEEARAPLSAIAFGLALGLAALAPLIAAFRNATRPPPAPEALLVLRDPADPSVRFRVSNVPPRLQLAALAGAQVLVVIVIVALVVGLTRR